MNPRAVRLTINPFATRYVAPGELEWCESEVGELDNLARRFEELGQLAQIVGPHGSGKTTLLHHLVPKLRIQANTAAGFKGRPLPHSDQMLWLTLRRGNTGFRFLSRKLQALGNGDLLILDGFDQLNCFQRSWVRLVARFKRCRLLVTCHKSRGLPILKEVRVTGELAKKIVKQAHLNANCNQPLPDLTSQMDLEKLLAKHKGSMRECLMELYDQVELNQANRPSDSFPIERGGKK